MSESSTHHPASYSQAHIKEETSQGLRDVAQPQGWGRGGTLSGPSRQGRDGFHSTGTYNGHHQPE